MEPILRRITPDDSEAVGGIIRTVMPEFGASGEGFAIHDSEVNDMYAAYNTTGTAYYVWEENGRIIGGGGVGPLAGASPEICELKKMYLLPEARGRGLGAKLLGTCLQAARTLGYRQCYLETFHTMKSAMQLYERFGFKRIPGSLGNTGHFGCDIFYSLDLDR